MGSVTLGWFLLLMDYIIIFLDSVCIGFAKKNSSESFVHSFVQSRFQ